LLACANLFFRDVRYIVQVLLTFGMFFTPVFFEADQIGARAGRIMMLNPVAPILEGLRLAVVNGHNLARPLVLSSGAVVWQPWHLAYSAVFATCGVVAAALLYSRLELTFAEYV
jgi:lipopolysaccharide transport system permease protein